MNKISTIIVDDEQLAREGIKKLLENEENIEIVRECENGEEAISAINNLMPDLVFLDIQMPEYNGFDVLKQINISKPPAVIFVTAYDKYAIQAFEVNALDYLLKPFNDSRFRTTLQRVLNYLRNEKMNELNRKIVSLIDFYENGSKRQLSQVGEKDEFCQNNKEYISRIMIKEMGKITFVNVEEIKWFEAMDYYVKIHTGDTSYLYRKSLKQLEKTLDPKIFIRIHRSTIVKFNEIKTMISTPAGDYKVILKDGTKLKLSRTRRQFLEKYVQ